MLPTLRVPKLFLDAQNNTLLSGPVPFGIVSACGTQLRKQPIQFPPLLTTVCFPPHSSGLVDDIDNTNLSDLTQVISLMAPYVFTLQDCCSTTSLPSAPVTPPATSEEPVNSLAPGVSSSTKDAAAAIVTVTVIMSAISAIDASDAQMLAAVLSSPCTCQNGALSTTTSTSSTTMLGLSIFSPLGSEWSVVGNVLLCLTLMAIHGLCVMAMPKPKMNAQSDVSSIETPRPSRLTWWRNTPHYSETLDQISRLRFPNVSVAMVLLLAPGVVRGVANTSQNFANASEEKNDSSVRLRIVAIVVGIVFLACTMLCLELIVYQHIDDEMVNLEDRTLPSSSAAMRRKRGMTHHQRRFYYAPYQQIVKVFAPVPRLVALIALPRGYWGPDAARNSYGGLVSKFIERWRRVWVVLPISNLIVQILSEIEDQCSVTQSLTLCILLATCIFFFTAVPHRAQLSSYLTCLSTGLTFVVAVFALACRLEPNDVSMNDVSSVGVFASLVAMLCQVYNIALPFVEQWLLRRNGAIPLPLLTDTQSSNSSFQHTMKEVSTTKTSLPMKSARTLIHHHLAEPQRVEEEVSMRQNQRQQRQRLLALRELIELVCSTSQEPASLSQLWCVQ
ncbi:GP46-like surface antigen, putative [Bodo saltans]|nr:GP46-like surface antigen, putative [Bodo saltans]|eukprot:CUG59786.1 GP46-like surface antigen, putative [Bodo saltans]